MSLRQPACNDGTPMILTIVSFFFFTGLVAVGTFLLTRKHKLDTTAGYFLGGRTLGAGFIAGSLLLTNLSTEQLVGLNGAAYKNGLSVMAWEVVAGVSLVVMALLFLPRYLKSGIATVPQFLEQRYNHRTRMMTTILFIFAYLVILLPIILYTGARGLIGILDLHTMFGIESEAGRVALLWGVVWFIGIVGAIYAIFGGLRTVAVSDTLNGFGLLVGGVLIAYLGLLAVNSEGIWPALTQMYEAHPEKFNSVGGPDQDVPFFTLFSGVLIINLFYWCTNQQIIQRTFAASSLAEGQRGVLLAGTFKIAAPIIVVLPGLIAFHLYHEQLPVDGADASYGRLVSDVLPPSLTGFFAAVLTGAILSSFNSALNSTATLFSLGVYQDLFHRDATDKQIIVAGKIFGWLVAIGAMCVAPLLLGQDSIFDYLQKMNALYFIPIFAVVLAGIVHRRVPAVAANIALPLGVVIIGLGYFVPSLEEYVKAMNAFHFVGAVFAGLFGMMLLWGQFAGRETPWEQKTVEDIDLTPWKYAPLAGGALVLIVLILYISLADFSIYWPAAEAPA